MTLHEINRVFQPGLNMFNTYSDYRPKPKDEDIDLAYVNHEDVFRWIRNESRTYSGCRFKSSVDIFELDTGQFQPYAIYLYPPQIRLQVTRVSDMTNETYMSPEYSIQLPQWMVFKLKLLLKP